MSDKIKLTDIAERMIGTSFKSITKKLISVPKEFMPELSDCAKTHYKHWKHWDLNPDKLDPETKQLYEKINEESMKFTSEMVWDENDKPEWIYNYDREGEEYQNYLNLKRELDQIKKSILDKELLDIENIYYPYVEIDINENHGDFVIEKIGYFTEWRIHSYYPQIRLENHFIVMVYYRFKEELTLDNFYDLSNKNLVISIHDIRSEAREFCFNGAYTGGFTEPIVPEKFYDKQISNISFEYSREDIKTRRFVQHDANIYCYYADNKSEVFDFIIRWEKYIQTIFPNFKRDKQSIPDQELGNWRKESEEVIGPIDVYRSITPRYVKPFNELKSSTKTYRQFLKKNYESMWTDDLDPQEMEKGKKMFDTQQIEIYQEMQGLLGKYGLMIFYNEDQGLDYCYRQAPGDGLIFETPSTSTPHKYHRQGINSVVPCQKFRGWIAMTIYKSYYDDPPEPDYYDLGMHILHKNRNIEIMASGNLQNLLKVIDTFVKMIEGHGWKNIENISDYLDFDGVDLFEFNENASIINLFNEVLNTLDNRLGDQNDSDLVEFKVPGIYELLDQIKTEKKSSRADWDSKIRYYQKWYDGETQGEIAESENTTQQNISKQINEVKGELARVTGELYEKYLESKFSKEFGEENVTRDGAKGKPDLIVKPEPNKIYLYSAKCYHVLGKNVETVSKSELGPELRYAWEINNNDPDKLIKVYLLFHEVRTGKTIELDIDWKNPEDNYTINLL